MLLIRIQSYNEPIKVGENNLYGLKKNLGMATGRVQIKFLYV